MINFFKKVFSSQEIQPQPTVIQNIWFGQNEVERIRDDGYIIYKSNRVTIEQRKQIGFYGLKRYSENGKYCAVYLCQDNEGENIGLIDVETGNILFKKELIRPHRCRVTNTGLVICEDWGLQNIRCCFLYVLSKDGVELHKTQYNSMMGDIFDLIDNETKFKYELNYSHEIFTINLT